MFQEKIPNNQEYQQKCSSCWVWGAILIIILLTALIRIHLLQVPLERDEGEYAYAGQLILQGILPYTEVYNMKMPGIYAVYALILAIFGQTHTGIHLGLLLVNTATIILVFLLGKRLFDPLTGVVAGASFAVLSLSQSVQGVFANTEHFVVLPAVGGIVLLLRAIDDNRMKPLFLSGLLLGLAFMMKQHGAFFIAFSGIYLLYSQLSRRQVDWSDCVLKFILFSIGVVIPFGLTCLVFLITGFFDKFWFWTFVYAREYASIVPFSLGLPILIYGILNILISSFLIWVLAGIGLASTIWNKRFRSLRFFIITFFIFSFLSVCIGFYFRPHYFVLLLPAIALLTGVGISSILGLFSETKSLTLKRGILILLVVIPLTFSIYRERKFLFQMNSNEASRSIYGVNPFPESLMIAEYIKKNTSRNDRIAVIGSEPQIYFYSQRRSATGYIYTYPLMEPHKYALKMQQEMIQEIESVSPEILVFVRVSGSWVSSWVGSWGWTRESEILIFSWFQQYVEKYYEMVGVVDIITPEKTVYKWGDKSIEYTPVSKVFLYILRRKE